MKHMAKTAAKTAATRKADQAPMKKPAKAAATMKAEKGTKTKKGNSAGSAGQPVRSEPDSAGQPALPDADSAAQPGTIPIIQVAFPKDMWWSLPPAKSKALDEQYLLGENAAYTWNWGTSRTGSYVQDDQATSFNRYEVDFTAMEQINVDNGRRRSIRIAWVHHVDAASGPKWTGQTKWNESTHRCCAA